MSIRGDLSRKKILTVARSLFAAKGFSAVTMQDICQGAELSRGGLYRHYSSTAEVFTAIIQADVADALDALADAKNRKITADNIVFSFLYARMNQLTDPTAYIDNATAEFAACCPEGKTLLAERAKASVKILTQLLEQGVEEGVFHCKNCTDAALHIICCLEGLGKHNALLPLTPEEIQVQFQFVRNMLL